MSPLVSASTDLDFSTVVGYYQLLSNEKSQLKKERNLAPELRFEVKEQKNYRDKRTDAETPFSNFSRKREKREYR